MALAKRVSRIKHLLVWLAWLLVAVAAYEFLTLTFHKYAHVEANAYGMFWSRRGWLWIHLGGGTLTILLGAVQFLTRFPRAYPRVHRWTGRIYLSALLVASAGAVGMIATSPAGLEIRSAFAATALAWLTTSLIGYRAILKGKAQLHRRWMTRNYLVTLAPITFRALIRIPGVMALASPVVMIPVLLWLSWALPLLLYEIGRRVLPVVRDLRANRVRMQPE